MKKDRIRIEAATDGHGRHNAVRVRDGVAQPGRLGTIRDGQPIPEKAELLLIGAADSDGWRDSTTLYTHTSTPTSNDETHDADQPTTKPLNGPAQVATPAYREGYDRIFGKKEVGLA